MVSNNSSHLKIIPVASGKGGVGKSLVTANLAANLARRGYKTIVVDLDLGGANLHSYLGLSNEHPGIGDFLFEKGSDLNRFPVPTGIPNLHFLAGDGLSPFLANLGYFQKIRLIKGLRQLPADFLVLDLSAGSTFNTLDFFNMSPNGLLVTTPEYSSIMNFMVFLKNLAIRTIVQEVSSNNKLRMFIDDAKKLTMKDKQTTVGHIIKEIQAISDEAANRIVMRLNNIKPRLVVNRTRDSEELDFLQTVIQNVSKRLSLEVTYLGSALEDITLVNNPRWKSPDSAAPMNGVFSKELDLICQRLLSQNP